MGPRESKGGTARKVSDTFAEKAGHACDDWALGVFCVTDLEASPRAERQTPSGTPLSSARGQRGNVRNSCVPLYFCHLLHCGLVQLTLWDR